MSALCYIALGSNMNNPQEQVLTAVKQIGQLPNTKLMISSSLYKTKPMDNKPQEDYINAVIAIKTSLKPDELMQALLALETAHGRERSGEKNQSRPLDLDILLYGNQVYQSALVTVPHYDLTHRAFVLVPLYEIAPALCLPDKTPIKTCLDKLSLAGVVHCEAA